MTDPMMARLDYMRKEDLTLDRDFLQDAVRAFAHKSEMHPSPRDLIDRMVTFMIRCNQVV